MSNVVAIGSQAVLVEMLENVLADAKAGHIVAFAGAAIGRDGDALEATYAHPREGKLYQLIGAVHVVQMRLLARVEGVFTPFEK